MGMILDMGYLILKICRILYIEIDFSCIWRKMCCFNKKKYLCNDDKICGCIEIYTEWCCGFCFLWLAVFSGVKMENFSISAPVVEFNINFIPWGKSVFNKFNFLFGKLKINWKWGINLLIKIHKFTILGSS